MKIIKNYKRLKKWAKTLFVTLLTISIVFASTGVATLFAYADTVDGLPQLERPIDFNSIFKNDMPQGQNITYDSSSHEIFTLGTPTA